MTFEEFIDWLRNQEQPLTIRTLGGRSNFCLNMNAESVECINSGKTKFTISNDSFDLTMTRYDELKKIESNTRAGQYVRPKWLVNRDSRLHPYIAAAIAFAQNEHPFQSRL